MIGSFRTRTLLRICTPAIVMAFVATIVGPISARAQTAESQSEIIYQKFQQTINLRGEGRYDAAVALLRDIMADYPQDDAVLRTAYNYLVSVYLAMDDRDAAMAAAREALLRFPDLTAEEITFPPRINEYYEQLRKEMFGSLAIRDPKDCDVFLDAAKVGVTPMHMDLVRVGTYTLKLTKSGYEDYIEQVTVEPDRALDMQVSLDRKRGWKWWTARVGVGALAVTLLAVGLSSGNDGGGAVTTAAPLPDPPAPPAN